MALTILGNEIRTFLGPQATADRRANKNERLDIKQELLIEKQQTKQILAETGSNLGGVLDNIFGGKEEPAPVAAAAEELPPPAGFLDDPMNQAALAVAAGAVLWKMSRKK